MNKKIAAVVVTYNRLPLLMENVKCLLSQSSVPDHIYLIDNASTDGTSDYCQKMQENYPELIEHCRMESNMGGSGGFWGGVKKAYENNYDYIWGMDDDAMPDECALEYLVQATVRWPSTQYCLCSNTLFQDNTGKTVLERIKKHDQKNVSLTFVGFFVPKEIVAVVGYPRNDLFIYYDDLDYSYSITEKGFEIVGIKESVIYHPYIMPNVTRKVLWRNVQIPVMPEWKMYYWMRNNLLIRRKRKRHYVQNLFLGLYNLLKILIFKREQFGTACRGFADGMLGISGRKKGLP